MGRIKSALIKRTAEKLLSKHNFTENFDENKKILSETIANKRFRNSVAGYITRLVKKQAKS